MAERRRTVRTYCGRMDHGGCSLLVDVEGGRIVRLRGDPQGWLNRGWVCFKALASPRRLDHPRRLRHPLLRVGPRGSGRWQRISWDQALDTIARRLEEVRREYGARAVAFAAGMPKGLDHFALIRLANCFGSPNLVAHQDVCHAPREISGVHTCGFYPVADLHHPTRLILLWGSNTTATNEEGQVNRLLRRRLAEGAELVVVDPRRTDLARRARLWLRLRPGSDAALALGMLRVMVEEELFDAAFVERWTHGFADLARHLERFTPRRVEELTWVPAQQIVEAARLYARARPAAIAWGNPIEHTRHNFHTARALICLMALAGNLDQPGGNVQAADPDITPLGRFVRTERLPDKRHTMLGAHFGTIPRLMTVPPAYFRHAVLTGRPYPVRALYAMGTNPLLTWADSRLTRRALEALDFLAVAELFLTPTAALADVVLPAASHFEFDDIGHYGLGHGYILARPQVVEPPPECRPDLQILCDLGRRLTPPELWPADYHGLLEEVLAPSGLSWEEFAAQGVLRGEVRPRKYQAKGFRTPTGKVELALSRAAELGLPELPDYPGPPQEIDADYPLVLSSRKSPNYLHSSYRWIERLRRREPEPLVEAHPETAARLGLEEGELVRVVTRRGAMVQRLRLADDLDPRVVYASYGWWFPEDAPEDPLMGWERANYNLLTDASEVGRQFGTPDLKGLACRLERVEE